MSTDPRYHICKDYVSLQYFSLAKYLPGNNLSQALDTFIGINATFIGRSPNNLVVILNKILGCREYYLHFINDGLDNECKFLINNEKIEPRFV